MTQHEYMVQQCSTPKGAAVYMSAACQGAVDAYILATTGRKAPMFLRALMVLQTITAMEKFMTTPYTPGGTSAPPFGTPPA